MNEQNIKYILWAVIFFIFFVLFNMWETEKKLINDLKLDNKITDINVKSFSDDFNYLSKIDDTISINTNLISAKIDLLKGDIVFLSLKNYPETINDIDKHIILLDKSKDKFYYTEYGFLVNNLDVNNIGKKFYHTQKASYSIKEESSNLLINLEYELFDNFYLNKVYVFKPYSYDINVDFYIRNDSNDIHSGYVYGSIKQEKKSVKNSIFNSSIKSYEGASVYTHLNSYKKLNFDDISSKSISFSSNGGWIAFLDNYFLTSWIPDQTFNYTFFAEKNEKNIYTLKYIINEKLNLSPGECKKFSGKLYVGPKIKTYLNKLTKGLDLVIDYGIFWPIASPIFILLSKINNIISNWGVSIILVTLMVKLLFFHLSSISYQSMSKMKNLQPRLNILKERYKDDKKMFGQAVLDLYKKEKVNPLSGCLPVLIQIPVFISLYYVLLESIELRHAHFFLWIKDLSSKDPYYILPIIMSLTIFIQQKLNPAVQDPLQAKVMMFLPFVFLLIFLQFQSGLILYWIVNNILSILQQFIIMRTYK